MAASAKALKKLSFIIVILGNGFFQEVVTSPTPGSRKLYVPEPAESGTQLSSGYRDYKVLKDRKAYQAESSWPSEPAWPAEEPTVPTTTAAPEEPEVLGRFSLKPLFLTYFAASAYFAWVLLKTQYYGTEIPGKAKKTIYWTNTFRSSSDDSALSLEDIGDAFANFLKKFH